LTDGGTVANGNYDVQFTLWDSLSGGSQIGSPQTLSTVSVSSGIFSVTLDFGAGAFTGANRFLEISARLAGGGSFTLLTPREQITSTPYAVRSSNATLADTSSNAMQLGGVVASQYVQANDANIAAERGAAGSAECSNAYLTTCRLADDNVGGNPINNRAFIDADYNRAFVATQYFGYLRRDADIGGFLFWLGQVNAAALRDVPRQHQMVCSFITSGEYQQRFGSVITRSNSECP
jgi:hypothetical protein